MATSYRLPCKWAVRRTSRRSLHWPMLGGLPLPGSTPGFPNVLYPSHTRFQGRHTCSLLIYWVSRPRKSAQGRRGSILWRDLGQLQDGSLLPVNQRQPELGMWSSCPATQILQISGSDLSLAQPNPAKGQAPLSSIPLHSLPFSEIAQSGLMQRQPSRRRNKLILVAKHDDLLVALFLFTAYYLSLPHHSANLSVT